MRNPLIAATAKAKLFDFSKNENKFVPVKVSYRRLDLLGHGVFGVVFSAKISNVKLRSDDQEVQDSEELFKVNVNERSNERFINFCLRKLERNESCN
jgi:hypothetical protein